MELEGDINKLIVVEFIVNDGQLIGKDDPVRDILVWKDDLNGGNMNAVEARLAQRDRQRVVFCGLHGARAQR